MRKDRVLAGALAAVTALSMTACGGGQAGGTTQAAAAGTQAAVENTANPNAETTLSIGYTTAANADDPYHFTATKFKEIVEEKSEGRIAVNLYASSQLGSEPEMWEGMQTGTCDMAVMTNAYVSSYVPANGALDLPFIFSDLAQAREIVDGDFGQSLIDNMDGTGVTCLAFSEGGFRQLCTKDKEIKAPSDLNGLKIRCMENQVHMDAFSALGMDPTPMAWSEVFTALQQGVIDGQENPIAVIYSNAVYEAQDYLAITNHVYSPSMILFSKPVFEGLDPAYQTALLEAAQEAAAYERSACEDSEAEQIAEMEAAGLEVTYPDTTEFQAAMAPVYEKYADQFGQENIDAIVNFEY